MDESKFDNFIGTVVSNFDHVIDFEVAEKLKSESGTFANFPGYHFYCDRVWYENERFHCEVWQYGVRRETISAVDIKSLHTAVCEKYGWE